MEPPTERRLGALRSALAGAATVAGPIRDHRGEVSGGADAGRLAPGVRRAWPGFKLHEQDAHLFVDSAAIETLENCYQGVSEARKLPVGNLLPIGVEPYEKAGGWYTGTYLNVLWDEEDQLFKMWYNVSRKLSDQRAESEDALAYATSVDGLVWEKPLLHLHEADGSTANNLVFPFFRWGTGTGVYKDPVELDPSRKYKMLFMFSTIEMSFAGISQPVCIAFSPDGVHWDIPKAWLNPVISHGTVRRNGFAVFKRKMRVLPRHARDTHEGSAFSKKRSIPFEPAGHAAELPLRHAHSSVRRVFARPSKRPRDYNGGVGGLHRLDRAGADRCA